MTDASDLPGLDLDAFRRWYDGVRPGEFTGELRGRLISGGKSNLTYEVTDATTTRIVRRPPLGHVQATAHDMHREYTVMTALAPTAVPVPATYAFCEDPDVIGERFYVMEQIVGTPYRTATQLAEIGPERTRAVAEAMVEVLATLHAVEPAAVGLADFGRPVGFLERQVRRWSRQLEGSWSRDLPDAERLLRRLQDTLPEGDDGSRAGIVHGDYRLDNLLVDASAEEPVRAVVDWEMSTLGDPLTDVALLAVYDRLGAAAGGRLVSDASTAPGYPTEHELLERYVAAGGRDLGDLGFHLGLAHFKLAVILEGIHFRHLQGQTLGEGFEGLGDAVPLILDAGLTSMNERI